MTDTEIINWLEKHPNWLHFNAPGEERYIQSRLPKNGYWRRTFGPKDKTNYFYTLRSAVEAQQKVLSLSDEPPVMPDWLAQFPEVVEANRRMGKNKVWRNPKPKRKL